MWWGYIIKPSFFREKLSYMLRGEATARFFPATGGAPLVSIVHPIDLATLTTRSLTPNVILNEKVSFHVTIKLTYIEKKLKRKIM